MREVHEFEANPNGRSPRSCRWCGKTPEWHARALEWAQLRQAIDAEVDRQLEGGDGGAPIEIPQQG